jgi:hypothetical protein
MYQLLSFVIAVGPVAERGRELYRMAGYSPAAMT